MGRSLEENESGERGQDLQEVDGGMTMRLQELNQQTPKSPASLVSSHVSTSPIHPHRFSV
jgi:PHS family inorganic phosphate transporter-like MFS transporter